MRSLEREACCSKSAILIGRAKVREHPHKMSSMTFAAFGPLGIRRIFVRMRLPIAGKQSTGTGKMILLMAVCWIAFLPATLDLPYSLVPSLLVTVIPSFNSFYLIRIRFAAPAEAPAKIAKKALANIKLGPFKGANCFANIFLVNNAIDIETATAPEYPFPKSVTVYELEAFLFP